MSIDKTAQIHSTSIIEDGAIIGANVKIGPFCYIGKDVVIGDFTELTSHIVINGHTKIGKNNKFYQFSSIGEINQDLKYQGEATKTVMGDNNTIRESVTIHRGTVQGSGVTSIGSENLFMVNAHIAHDCHVGNNCILANNATLAGHVEIDDYAIIGGMTAIHQFCIIGRHTMVGGCSAVAQDIPPYVIAQGNHAKPFGVNLIGLKRHQFTKSQLRAINQSYKKIYRSGLTLDEAKESLTQLVETETEAMVFLNFINRSTRGIIR